ncbi:uncharacterized protein Hap1MRO34_026095 [Clarias gariepinus]|uniref:uncharacterized protein LOC128541702 n=1 Tax=Clarias gariepinus TaxID=13013 RepID=UPI00234D4DDE|nr:uncharacterized protein LOC128541702 [Clarias gariepinus]
MSELLFTPQLLFGIISLSLLQIISADLISVDPGENITLLCNITQVSEISWYQMNSASVRQIISARQRGLYKDFYVDYNVDESHFDVTESSSSVSLVIIGVRETDLGFYYCGGRNDTTHTQFGKNIKLNFTTGSQNRKADGSDTLQFDPHTYCKVIIIILSCMCTLLVSVNIICSSLYCFMLQDKCSFLGNSYNKEAEFQPSDVTCVTYTCVSSRPRKHYEPEDYNQ